MFGNRCCLTGIGRREVLIASHILPWKLSDPWQKVDPNNGLLLNAFHDSLFDKYLMTVRDDGSVEYLDSLKDSLGDTYRSMCSKYTKVKFPDDYSPIKESFEHHNKRFEAIMEMEGRT